MRWILICFVIAILGFMAYVRLASDHPEKQHVAGVARDPGDYPTAGSFTAVRALAADPAQVLAAVNDIAMRTPRTTVLAGSVDDGMITYVTRSRIMGFPDYTTVSINDEGAAPLITIHGRLRFGQADLGVNKARVQGWLGQVGPLIAAP